MDALKYLLICLVVFSSCVEEDMLYYDPAKHRIQTKGGVTYVDDLPVTGIILSRYTTGDTASAARYEDGRLSGIEKTFHENGKLKSIRLYKNGWKQGEHKGWHENGNQQFIYHFTDDQFDGNQKEWLSNGQLYADLNYVMGSEEGTQRVWYPNGKVKTNYIIKNNRRYGLLGTKNCVNTVDSVTLLR